MMMRSVFCTFRVVGFHRWGNAPKRLAYLASNHRHEFHFKVEIEVGHNDREVEFITLKETCLNIINDQYIKDVSGNLVFDQMSCEMIAERLMQALLINEAYASKISTEENPSGEARQIIIKVSEDGENGGCVSRF